MSGCPLMVSNTNSRINRGRFATTTRIGWVISFAPSSDRVNSSAHYRRVSAKREGSKKVDLSTMGSTIEIYKMGYAGTALVPIEYYIWYQYLRRWTKCRSMLENTQLVY